MENLLIFLPFLVPAVVAQFDPQKRWAKPATYGTLMAINLGLLGIVGLAVLGQLSVLLMPEALDPAVQAVHWLGVAIAVLITALVACLPLLPKVRLGLARWLPIDPHSMVHMTALVFAVYQIGLNLAQMALIGDLETLADTELALTIGDVLLSGLPLLLFATVGVGLFVRRDWASTLDRLGLHRPTWKQGLAAAGLTVVLIALNYGIDTLWAAVDPAGYDLVSRVTENLFGGLTTVTGALVLGLSAGISEEVLFRGAIQPKLGLVLTTLLFAVGHLQYGLSVAMFQVFIIGLVLGLVRMRANTTTCIAIHAAYNALIVLLGLLQT